MAENLTGQDALSVLNDEGQGEKTGGEFSPLKSGQSYFVKMLGTQDVMLFHSYGIYKVVNSFVSANPSKKTNRGTPIENLGPWDLAWKYNADRSEDYQDEYGQEAHKYKPKVRFALGFFDLDSGEQIIIDLSKKQAQGVMQTVSKYADKIDKLAFELSKQGSGTNTTVNLTPVIDFSEDLSDKQQENFKNAPEQFDHSLFENLLYEANEEEQLQLLEQAGFDVSLINYEKPEQKTEDTEQVGEEVELDADGYGQEYPVF